jgi:hypothetical protein
MGFFLLLLSLKERQHINNQKIIIKHHAFVRAIQRKIHPDLIEDCLQMGKIKRFGKNKIKFERRLKKRTIICIGEVSKEEIKIITIEKK